MNQCSARSLSAGCPAFPAIEQPRLLPQTPHRPPAPPPFPAVWRFPFTTERQAPRPRWLPRSAAARPPWRLRSAGCCSWRTWTISSGRPRWVRVPRPGVDPGRVRRWRWGVGGDSLAAGGTRLSAGGGEGAEGGASTRQITESFLEEKPLKIVLSNR